MLRKLCSLIAGAFIAGLAGGISGIPAAQADVPETKDPIKLVIMGYSGDNIIMFILGDLLEKLGYNVENTPADYLGQFAGLKAGDLHIGSPGWDTTAKAAMADAWGSGQVLNMGNIGIAVNEDWWYPLYVKDVCPGLPDWKALLEPQCVEALSVVETAPNARFLSGPIEWGGYDAERIEALDMAFEVIHAGSDAALTAEFVATIKRKQPIVGWTWEPFWLPALYEGEFVTWPEYDDACYEDPAWGPILTRPMTAAGRRASCGSRPGRAAKRFGPKPMTSGASSTLMPRPWARWSTRATSKGFPPRSSPSSGSRQTRTSGRLGSNSRARFTAGLTAAAPIPAGRCPCRSGLDCRYGSLRPVANRLTGDR